MTDSTNQFRVVLRGYDPAQVDRRVQELAKMAEAANQQVQELTRRVQQVEHDRAQDGEQEAQQASFVHLGERISQMLVLAEDEAAELRELAQAEMESAQKQAHEAGSRIRDEADRYSEQRRSETDTEAARVLEDARRMSDERLDSAERDAAARLQEAEAIYENQRAKAAQSAADFETTLAKRRERVEQEFTDQMTLSQQQLEAAEARAEQVRAEAEQVHADSAREVHGLVESARQQAEGIVKEAKVHAARVRAESERELDAATQRRDSINAQLANVRQMLATLSGAAPSLVAAPDLEDDEPVVAEPDVEAALEDEPTDTETEAAEQSDAEQGRK